MTSEFVSFVSETEKEDFQGVAGVIIYGLDNSIFMNCPFCSKNFPLHNEIMIERGHFVSVEKSIKCPHCEKKYYVIRGKVIHLAD